MSWLGGSFNGTSSAHQFTVVTGEANAVVTLKEATASTSDNSKVWIDWGDGTRESVSSVISSKNIAHTYATAGEYLIRTWNLDFDWANPSGDSWSYEALGQTGLTVSGAGGGAGSLLSFGLLNHTSILYGRWKFGNPSISWDTTAVTDYPIGAMGRTTSFLNSNGHWESSFNFDTPAENPVTGRNFDWFSVEPGQGPTNTESMFRFNANFNPIVTNWDMTRCANCKQMFRGNAGFQGIGLNNWDTSGIGNFGLMLQENDVANYDIENWTFESVADLFQIVYECGSFDRDISGWFTNGAGFRNIVPNMSGMLSNTAMSTENYSKYLIGLANWLNTPGTPNSTNVALGASGLTYNSTSYPGIGGGTYSDAVSARAYLVTFGFNITDGGVV